MRVLTFIIFFLLLNNISNALTFKSDGSVISSKGEILTKSFAERYQQALEQYINGDEVLDWPIVELDNSGNS